MHKSFAHLLPFCVLFAAAAARGGIVVNDGSLGTAPVMHSGNMFTITPASGKQVGSNLFYSLSTLNLVKGETASFTGPNSVANVLTRVTGGPSSIDGTLQCTIPNANFYLINPAGVVFGPDAALDIRGSFAVTTADEVKLADGQIYAALPATTDATLTSAAPAAFGFLSTPPAMVAINGSILAVSAGQCLSAIGGRITLSGGNLSAPGGRITIASVASAGTATLNASDPASTLQTTSFSALGPISIDSGALVSADGANAPGGRIEVQCDSLTLTGSKVSSETTGPSGKGAGIDLNVRSNVISTNSSVVSGTESAGAAGNLTIEGGDIAIAGDNPNDHANSFTTHAKNETVTSQQVKGNAGQLTVNAQSLNISDGAYLSADTFGSGAAGNTSVTVKDQVFLDGTLMPTGLDGIVTQSSLGSPQTGGNITLSAASLTMLNGAKIETSGASAGTLTITLSGNATVDGIAAPTGIEAIGGIGGGGNVNFSAQSLTILPNGSIDGNAAEGTGGSVKLTVTGPLVMIGKGNLKIPSTGLFAVGQTGGNLTVSAASLTLQNGAVIESFALVSNGGNIAVQSAGPVVVQNSELDSSAHGTGGNITIDPSLAVLQNSLVNASASKGHGGNVMITAGQFLDFNTTINVSSQFGVAGTVVISSPDSDIAASLVGLQADLANAGVGLEPACGEMTGGNISSFVPIGNGGAMAEPGGLMFSFEPDSFRLTP